MEVLRLNKADGAESESLVLEPSLEENSNVLRVLLGPCGMLYGKFTGLSESSLITVKFVIRNLCGRTGDDLDKCRDFQIICDLELIFPSCPN